MIALAVAFLAMTAGAMALGIVGRLSIRGKLPPNRWAGIRTPYTFSSDEAWYATHRHAGPILARAGFGIAGFSAALAILTLGDAIPVWLQVAGAMVAALAALGAAIAAWAVGTRRARRELEAPAP